MLARHCRIEGRVQGIGYRQAMQHKAEELGLVGWVRNRRDGSVEALICGDEAAIGHMLDWARHGPRFAKITQVLAAATEPSTDAGFMILPTE